MMVSGREKEQVSESRAGNLRVGMWKSRYKGVCRWHFLLKWHTTAPLFSKPPLPQSRTSTQRRAISELDEVHQKHVRKWNEEALSLICSMLVLKGKYCWLNSSQLMVSKL